jgi:hypothetical protein
VVRDWPSWYWPVAQALERAEVAFGVAVAYDWLLPLLSAPEVAEVQAALGSQVLQSRLQDERQGMWWTADDGNWGINANGPLLAASLALADEPAWASAAASVTATVLRDMAVPVGSFSPQGVWPEGFAYAGYTQLSLSMACAVLASSGAGDAPSSPALPAGLLAGVCDWQGTVPAPCSAGAVDLLISSQTGGRFDYSDGGPGSAPPSATLFYAASACARPEYAAAARRLRAGGGSGVLDVIWFSPAGSGAELQALPLAAVLAEDSSAKTHLGAFRTGWVWAPEPTPGQLALQLAQPAAAAAQAAPLDSPAWLGFKGGLNYFQGNSCNNHGHLDVGTFSYEALGVRWFVDMGGDAYDYPLLSYFGRFRFSYHATSSLAHNVLRFDSDTQHRSGSGSITGFNASSSGSLQVTLSPVC